MFIYYYVIVVLSTINYYFFEKYFYTIKNAPMGANHRGVLRGNYR